MELFLDRAGRGLAARDEAMTHAPRFLHVANGTSTTTSIEASGIGGTVSIWADPLYEGPVPGGISDDALVDVRASFLSRPGRPVLRRSRERPAAVAPVDRRGRRLRRAGAVVRARPLRPAQSRPAPRPMSARTCPAGTAVSLVCIGSFPAARSSRGSVSCRPRRLPGLLAQRADGDRRAIRGGRARVGRVSRAIAAPGRGAAARGHTGAAVPRASAAPPARGISGHRRRPVAQRAHGCCS